MTEKQLTEFLTQCAGKQVPGLQYVVVNANEVIYEFAGGMADMLNKQPMTLNTTLMAYSMTKTFTAVAVLQSVERQKLSLNDVIDEYLPEGYYRGHNITIRQLLSHTAGISNPIPFDWVHLVEEHAYFNEATALANVIREHPKLSSSPGKKYAYSNIGYWLLGKIVEQAWGQSFSEYVRTNILQRLTISLHDMNFIIHDLKQHAKGYLAKYSLMNLLKSLMIDNKYIGEYESKWLHINNHYVNGPAFGGLIGNARGFSYLLQDQLQNTSVLFNSNTKSLLETQQVNRDGKLVPMTLGWHVGKLEGDTYFFKEGGGGGFHAEMRIYPNKGIGSVVMANNTGFNSTRFLNRVDKSLR